MRTACLFSPATALARIYLAAGGGGGSGAGQQAAVLLGARRRHGIYGSGGACWTAAVATQRRPGGQQRDVHHRAGAPRRAPTTAASARRPGGGGVAVPHVRPAPRSSPAGPRAANGSGSSNGNDNGNGNGNDKRGADGPSQGHVAYRLGRLPRDEEITQAEVVLRQEDGALSAPEATAAVLARLDRRTQSLVVLALPTAGGGEAAGGKGLRHPICRVVDRAAERKVQAERAKEQRKKAVGTKELELNWAIDPHDLGHRLTKLRAFLDKGLRVEVSLLRKRKGKGRRQATAEEAAELVRRVRETVAAVPGARETKGMEGELLRTAKLFLEGTSQE